MFSLWVLTDDTSIFGLNADEKQGVVSFDVSKGGEM
jgi:hypothetical protein